MSMEAQFYACVPVKMLDVPVNKFTPHEQKRLLMDVFGHSLYKKYAPPISYQLCFLKWIIKQAEALEQTVCDELYELYGSLVSLPITNNEFCFKSYKTGENRYVTLKESTQIISSGTTGLTTWQAAYYFLEWAMANPKEFNQKRILELGCGLGLVGLTLCSTCEPTCYCFTDCHPQVLSFLRENIDINLMEKAKQNTAQASCCPEIQVRELDWEADTESLLETVGPVDCVLATDVIYDVQTTDLFVQVIKKILRHNTRTVSYVTSTIRSRQSYQHFCLQLDANSIKREKISGPISCHNSLFYDRSQNYEILKLVNSHLILS